MHFRQKQSSATIRSSIFGVRSSNLVFLRLFGCKKRFMPIIVVTDSLTVQLTDMIMIDVEGDDSYVGDSMTMATITMLL